MFRLIALAVAGFAAYHYFIRPRHANEPVALLPKPERSRSRRRAASA